jgi:hypothetical protein
MSKVKSKDTKIERNKQRDKEVNRHYTIETLRNIAGALGVSSSELLK